MKTSLQLTDYGKRYVFSHVLNTQELDIKDCGNDIYVVNGKLYELFDDKWTSFMPSFFQLYDYKDVEMRPGTAHNYIVRCAWKKGD